VHEVCIAHYRPGATFREIGEKVDSHLKARGLGQFAQDFRGIVRLGGYNHSIRTGCCSSSRRAACERGAGSSTLSSNGTR
jgi:hypothetical protein